MGEPSPGRVPWIVVVLPLAVAAGTAGWLWSASIAPLVDGRTIDYILILPSLRRLLAFCAVALLATGVVYAVSPRAVWAFGLLAIVPLAVALLATPLRSYAGPWLYVAFDLRWWLIAAVVLLVITERLPWDGLKTVPYRYRTGMLTALLALCSLLASPPLRFQSALIGDEPKYLRYLENWYRGRGMDVADLGPIADLPADYHSHLLGNVALVVTGLGTAAADAVHDASRRTGRPSPPAPGPARSGGGWFVEGKRGGVYQVHNPGIAFLLLPGYLIDRAVSHTHDWHPQFPTTLYFTNLTLLVLYLCWTLAVLRLLSAWCDRPGVAWIVTAVVMLSLPMSAFAYQYYPEAAAGLVVALLARYALFSEDHRAAPMLACGLLTGFLPWLHIRFLLVAVLTAAAVTWTRRGARKAVMLFSFGLVLPLAALAAYYYNVTGNPMPWALYAITQADPVFSAARASHDLPAFWFDRTWGLIAHAPVFVFALPGVWLAWRRNAAATIWLVLAIAAVAIPSAGNGYTGAFTTPLRLVAAVVPLLVLPMAETVAAFRSSRWFTAVFVVAAVVSVQNGLTYNAHFIKSQSSMQAATMSGWLSPLLLPDFEAGRLAQPLTWIWIAVTLGLVALPIIAARVAPAGLRRLTSPVVVAASVVGACACLASGAAALSGAGFNADYAVRPGDARDRLIHAALAGTTRLQWSSAHGWIDLRRYFLNPPETETALTTRPTVPRTGQTAEFIVSATRPGRRPGWGVATIDFGDGTRALRVPVEGSAGVRHAYARPGDYTVRVSLDLWGLPARTLTERMQVGN